MYHKVVTMRTAEEAIWVFYSSVRFYFWGSNDNGFDNLGPSIFYFFALVNGLSLCKKPDSQMD